MRVLVCHNDYKSFGGESKVVHDEVEMLKLKGYDVETLMVDNHETESYGILRKILFFPRAVFNFGTYRRVVKLIDSFKPDIAHVHNVFPLLSPSIYWAFIKSGIPVVQTIHNYRLLCPNGLFYTRGRVCEKCKMGNYWHSVRFRCYKNSYMLTAIYAFSIWLHRKLGLLNRISAYFFLSEFARSKFIEAGCLPEKLFVKKREWNIAESFSNASGRHALYIGRLSREKGVTTLVNAFLDERRLPLKIAGSGPLLDELKTKVKEKQGANIEFTGFIKDKQKELVLRSSLFVIVPSECYEHMPVSIVEAYSSGKPVLGAKVGSVTEMVKEGVTGILFESGNEVDLRSKVCFLFDNPEEIERMADNLRDVNRWFASDKEYFRELYELYDWVAVKAC